MLPSASSRKPSSPAMPSKIFACRRSSSPKPSSNRRRKGPSEQEALKSFARPSSNALRPSKSRRSEEHTSELQSLMRISYAVFCLKKKKTKKQNKSNTTQVYAQQHEHQSESHHNHK